MLRTIFTIGLFAILGLFALRLAFGVLKFGFVLFIALAKMALWVGAIGLLIYLVVRIVSPDTARRIRERWSGNAA